MFDIKMAGQVALLSMVAVLAASTGHAAQNLGEKKFREHCVACHADGGNITKPDKTLSRKDREAHGIRTSRDIIKLIRKPGEGMTAFDNGAISDKEAKAIAEYIIKTFK